MARQCVAVCCSVLQCVAVRCSALQCVAVCCSALQCVAVHRWVMLHVRISHATTIVHRSKRALCRRKRDQYFSQKNIYRWHDSLMQECVVSLVHAGCISRANIHDRTPLSRANVTGLTCREQINTLQDSLVEQLDLPPKLRHYCFLSNKSTSRMHTSHGKYSTYTWQDSLVESQRDRTHLPRANQHVTGLICLGLIYMWQDSLVESN